MMFVIPGSVLSVWVGSSRFKRKQEVSLYGERKVSDVCVNEKNLHGFVPTQTH